MQGRSKRKNFNMSNKGKGLERIVEVSNDVYMRRREALVQKISTPWTVVRDGTNIISAFPSGKSTLDFRGTITGGLSISFDCKESEELKGLPLKYIEDHQIEYIRIALEVEEVAFIITEIKPLFKRFLIPGQIVLDYWDAWKKNKGKRGYNLISIKDMIEIQSGRGVPLDYLAAINPELYVK